MLSIPPGRRIWLCVQPTDMRRSFDGLSALVRTHLGEDPTSGQWFAFINRRRTQIKVLAFEPLKLLFQGSEIGAQARVFPL